MTRKAELIQEVRDNPFYLKDYLTLKGIDTESRRNFKCLVHEDGRVPNMAYDPKRNRVKCFSCGFSGSVIDLIGVEYGLDTDSDKINKTLEYFNLSPTSPYRPPAQNQPKTERIEAPKPEAKTVNPEIEALITKAHQHAKDTDYYARRGLGKEIINKYRLGYDPTTRRVIIPVGNNYYIQRSTEEKIYYNLKDVEAQILNPSYLKDATANQVIFLVEGAIDALSIEEVGGRAIALNSTANAPKLLAYCKEYQPQATLALSLDNDEAGTKATREIAKGLQFLKVPFLEANVSGISKDPNEALLTDRNALKRAVESVRTVQEMGREEYLKNSTASHIKDFIDGIQDSVNTEATPTGFTRLDNALDGGLYEGLYILGAISSIGKTTLLLQIADQIAEQGRDVLLFSLEMARYELMAKSISRLTSVNAKDQRQAKTTRGIMVGKRYLKYSQEEKDLIKKAVNQYRGYANHVFIREGLGEVGVKQIREAVEKHITLMGYSPIVMVDYLQLVAPFEPRATDKQNTDKAVMELKRISRDFKIPVIAVSSFNRQNYKNPVAMEAFKESGAIEYSSDVLIGLQVKGAGADGLNITEVLRQDPRQVELVILKNRNGKTGDILPFEYYPLFNRYHEPEGVTTQEAYEALT